MAKAATTARTAAMRSVRKPPSSSLGLAGDDLLRLRSIGQLVDGSGQPGASRLDLRLELFDRLSLLAHRALPSSWGKA